MIFPYEVDQGRLREYRTRAYTRENALRRHRDRDIERGQDATACFSGEERVAIEELDLFDRGCVTAGACTKLRASRGCKSNVNPSPVRECRHTRTAGSQDDRECTRARALILSIDARPPASPVECVYSHPRLPLALVRIPLERGVRRLRAPPRHPPLYRPSPVFFISISLFLFLSLLLPPSHKSAGCGVRCP